MHSHALMPLPALAGVEWKVAEIAGRIRLKARPHLVGGVRCFQVINCQGSRRHQSGSSAPGDRMRIPLGAP